MKNIFVNSSICRIADHWNNLFGSYEISHKEVIYLLPKQYQPFDHRKDVKLSNQLILRNHVIIRDFDL
jgi:hypothetical protein